MNNNARLINQTSGKQNWWTPVEIIEAARRAMKGITLDPASSAGANKRVRAICYFTPLDSALECPWHGNIFMNHPFGRRENPLWINKLISEFERGNVSQACCITFAATSETWFQPLYNYPLCFLSPRTEYFDPATGTTARGVPKGSVVAALGIDPDRFSDAFCDMGRVLVAHKQIRRR